MCGQSRPCGAVDERETKLTNSYLDVADGRGGLDQAVRDKCQIRLERAEVRGKGLAMDEDELGVREHLREPRNSRGVGRGLEDEAEEQTIKKGKK